ncbi:hypothetical protein F66182_1057 [Fusarium sp. NRRL 66182]|nr:hypothetical protein F66182_1057 [Fusarium sp. NRRL 66182]
MSNTGNNIPISSPKVDSTADYKHSSSKAADPETASISTFSSYAPLVKEEKKKKNGTNIDTQKLQEQALRSQIQFSM